MVSLDRLGWSAGISFISHGARFGVRVNDSSILTRLPDYLPPGSRSSRSPVVDYLYSLRVGCSARCGGRPSGSDAFQLYGGAERIQESIDLGEVLETLQSHLHFDTALGARRKLFVHAGVVAWRGQAIVIPGRSFSGKTSLVAALVRAGATYYSDEYAVLDRRGWVHPYPKPLSIRSKEGNTAVQCPVEALGGQAATEPLPVGLVAVTAYVNGACWRPYALSPGQIVMALLDNTVLARYKPKIALSTLGSVAEQAKGVGGERGEAEKAAPLLLECLSRGTRALVGDARKIES